MGLFKSSVSRRTVLSGGSLAAIDFCMAAPAHGASNSDPVVECAYGRLRGRFQGGTYSFKGVPYAGPTSGASRFMPPTPVTPWKGVRDATQYGPHAPQSPLVYHGSPGERLLYPWPYEPTLSSEDCLTLNIWTPGQNHMCSRPVMVWLHGGGFESGSGNSLLYDGSHLSTRGDVVVVTVNHRLNILGYCHLGDVGGPDYASSGNAGQLDLIAALKWIRDNISAFGGDPSNVTLFGQSGGGGKVSMLLAMPDAQGLFHKAIIQSGPGLRASTREVANRLTAATLKVLDIAPQHVARLQAVPVETLIAAVRPAALAASKDGALIAGFSGLLPTFGPVLDPATLPHHPFDPDASPLSDAIPVLIGSTRDETAFFATSDRAVWDRTLSFEELATRVTLFEGAVSTMEVINTYKSAYPFKSPADLFIAITTGKSNGIRSIQLAERKAARRKADVFMYRFDWPTPFCDGRFGACHAVDIGFGFDNLDRMPNLTDDDAASRRLAAEFSGSFVRFARSGHPGDAGERSWPAYETDRRMTRIFDGSSSLVSDPDSSLRRLWERLG